MYRVGKIKLSKEGISLQISEEILEKIKSQNDIVDVISERVRLKKAGRNFTGLCPFHNEKTPFLFRISRETNFQVPWMW